MTDKEVHYPDIEIGEGKNKSIHKSLIGWRERQSLNPFDDKCRPQNDEAAFSHSRVGHVFKWLQIIRESCCLILEKEGFSCTEIMKDNLDIEGATEAHIAHRILRTLDLLVHYVTQVSPDFVGNPSQKERLTPNVLKDALLSIHSKDRNIIEIMAYMLKLLPDISSLNIKGGIEVDALTGMKSKADRSKGGQADIERDQFLICEAKKIWGKKSTLCISYVCELLMECLKKSEYAVIMENSIKARLKKAEREGLLSIPDKARKKGCSKIFTSDKL